MSLDDMFDGFDNVSIYGDTTISTGKFVKPAGTLRVDQGASIIWDEVFNREAPEYTGDGSVTICKVPMTDQDTN